jgi:cellulose synthase/poly-beta-1,6-N-acetylglucosamine synthase-like glycosyltransferase
VLGDGHSTDGTLKIARKSGAKIAFEEGRTIASGRQAALEASSGEIIVFSDADAIQPVDWLEKLLKPFSDPKVVGVFGGMRLVEKRKNLLVPFFDFFISSLHFLGFDFAVGSNMAARKEVLERIGGFNVKLVTCEDLDLFKRARKEGKTVFAGDCVVSVSSRRLEKEGFLKWSLLHIKNFFDFILGKRVLEHYAPVR